MIIGYITGSLALIVFAVLWVIIQFGIVAAMFVVGFLAIVIAALIGTVIWVITALVNSRIADNKHGTHF